jgi:hypothetical protein
MGQHTAMTSSARHITVAAGFSLTNPSATAAAKPTSAKQDAITFEGISAHSVASPLNHRTD